MWREAEYSDYYPVAPVARRAKPRFQRVDETVNRYAAKYMGWVAAVGPFFYAVLFLAYLAAAFGVIS